jgi:hypothetical protein
VSFPSEARILEHTEPEPDQPLVEELNVTDVILPGQRERKREREISNSQLMFLARVGSSGTSLRRYFR